MTLKTSWLYYVWCSILNVKMWNFSNETNSILKERVIRKTTSIYSVYRIEIQLHNWPSRAINFSWKDEKARSFVCFLDKVCILVGPEAIGFIRSGNETDFEAISWCNVEKSFFIKRNTVLLRRKYWLRNILSDFWRNKKFLFSGTFSAKSEMVTVETQSCEMILKT